MTTPMIVFISIVATFSILVSVITLLFSIANMGYLTQMKLEQAKSSIYLSKITSDQMILGVSVSNLANAMVILNAKISMMYDLDLENDEGFPRAFIQTANGNITARSPEDAIEKLQEKGVKLTEEDIEELHKLFENGPKDE